MFIKNQNRVQSSIITCTKWLLGLLLVWLLFLLITIINYPVGKLSDNADAAIVLGAAIHGVEPSPVFAERLNHAINLYHLGKVRKLVFTGGVGNQKAHAESVVAREYALNNNVNRDDIHIETCSSTTHENLLFAQPILEREKLQSVLIISDSMHSKRALLMAHDLGIQAKASATPTSRYQSLKKKLPFALRELYFYHHYLLFNA